MKGLLICPQTQPTYKVLANKIIVDTGPIVALLNRRDAHHTWSVDQARQLEPPFITCEAVLAEAHFLLAGIHQGNVQLNHLIGSGKLVLTSAVEHNLARISQLMLTYQNVPMSFADASLVCLAEQFSGTVFTLDSDFHVYRKNQKDAINLIIP